MMRALVAHDDRAAAAVLRSTLERWGLEIVVVHDGADAWKALQDDGGIGLAVLDWSMPGFDGPVPSPRALIASTYTRHI